MDKLIEQVEVDLKASESAAETLAAGDRAGYNKIVAKVCSFTISLPVYPAFRQGQRSQAFFGEKAFSLTEDLPGQTSRSSNSIDLRQGQNDRKSINRQV